MYRIPAIDNEKLYSYGAGSDDRSKLKDAMRTLRKQSSLQVPLVINGQEIKSEKIQKQLNPSDKSVLVEYYEASEAHIRIAIEGAMGAKKKWELMPFHDRAAVFLKAADLIAGKYRFEIMAATMLGQGKNAWQAEIDAAAELVDFLRFNVKYAEEILAVQPAKNAPGVWNRTEYRPLEGFVYAITPFNFTAIAGNLAGAPALMGNVVLHKPSPSAVFSNYIIHRIFSEAGLPAGVIQFVPGPAEEITQQILSSPDFACLHYTGSTAVFKSIYKKIALNLDTYHSYPRIVGETGGKNFHLIHQSAHVENAVINTVRGAFEFQGQKCSACSRAYVSQSVWDNGFKTRLIQEVEKLKVGTPEQFDNFIGPVIHQAAFDRLKQVIEDAKSAKMEILAGGKYDDSKGFFVHPTVILVNDPHSELMTREFFGPVLAIHVFDDSKWDDMFSVVDSTTGYALTGAIFAQDRDVIAKATQELRHSAGNFYINDKCTGAVVSQQPFGGARGSGTNDKAGSQALLWRFVSMRSVKENMVDATQVLYPSNEA